MSVEELISKLEKFPPHFQVQAVKVHDEDDDETSELEGILHHGNEKIVYLEVEQYAFVQSRGGGF